MQTDPSTHLFWITSRAAGTVAIGLASVAVCCGVLRSSRRGRGDLRTLHESLSLACMLAIAVHALALLGDQYLRPALLDVLVPLHGGYKAGWTSTGIVAGWALVLLGASYYVRGRIGVRRWQKLHRLTALAWIGGLVHTLGEGTDAGQTWFLVLLAIPALPAAVLLLRRTFDRPRAQSDPARAT
ncbi:MAG: hypothetical protein NVS1B9_02040 [Solirubrobacteraceae bacterium]